MIITNDEIGDQKREVEELLGRCLIKLQQVEQLIKAMIATQEISGTPETFELEQAARKLEVSDKTLGAMISRLLTEVVRPEGQEPPKHVDDSGDPAPFFSVRVQTILASSTFENLQSELRELVALRNGLVHHFTERHDLRTKDGCEKAVATLRRSCEEIDRQFEQMRSFAVSSDQTRRSLSDLMQTSAFRDLVINGIGLDGEVCWPMAGIVSALQEAFEACSVDGWLSLELAARWIAENRPEQTPQKYGCLRWRHVVHKSQQFELRRFEHKGKFGGWFRPRSSCD